MSTADRIDYYSKQSGECIEWTGATIRSKAYKDYGVCRVDGKQMLAHRAAYLVAHGSIPDGLFVMHTCDNPLCVNPDHLTVGTHADNMHDMVAKGRSHPGEKCGTAILSNREAIDIFARTKNNEPNKKIAQDYGISVATVRAIKNEKRWSSITGIGFADPLC